MLQKVCLSLLCGSLLLSACGPTHDLKKAKKLIARAEAHGAKVDSAVVYRTITKIAPAKQADTTTYYKTLRDTIKLVSPNKIITKLKIDTVNKTVYVDVKCPPDTVKVKVPVTITQKISAGYTGWQVIKRCALVAIILIGAGYVVAKIKKFI